MSGLGEVILDIGWYVTEVSVSSTSTSSILSCNSVFSGGEGTRTPGPCGCGLIAERTLG